MERTITVKGTGKASFKPDTIVLNLTVSVLEQKYDEAMTLAENKLGSLRRALKPIGFETADVKTADFSVRTEKKSAHDKNGNYTTVFAGYRIVHSLKIEFEADFDRLGKALSAVSKSGVEPELDIGFTVKDKDKVSAAVLEAAARSASEKAKVLAAASGVKLGTLVNIDYNFSERDMYSPTRFCANADGAAVRSMQIEPEDVSVTDSVVFTWTID